MRDNVPSTARLYVALASCHSRLNRGITLVRLVRLIIYRVRPESSSLPPAMMDASVVLAT